MQMTTLDTHIVNIRVQNIRPKYSNLKEWMDDNDNVYIGRKGVVFIDGQRFPKDSSVWANPYKISENETREDVIKKYEKYIREKIVKENLLNELKKLNGKNLGCWCKPLACHGDVLLKIIEEYKN